jgi:hypothetical protein
MAMLNQAGALNIDNTAAVFPFLKKNRNGKVYLLVSYLGA